MSLNTRIKNTIFKISEFSEDKTPESAEFAIIRPFWSGLFFQISTISAGIATVSATVATVIAVATILSINAPKEVSYNSTNSSTVLTTLITTLSTTSSTTPVITTGQSTTITSTISITTTSSTIITTQALVLNKRKRRNIEK